MPTKRAGGADGDHDAQQRVGARAAREVVDHRHEHEQEQLLAVGDADRGVEREAGGQQRRRRVGDQRPEERGRLDAARLRQVQREPAQHRHAQQDLRRRDRELHRRGEAHQGRHAGQLDAMAGEAPGCWNGQHSRQVVQLNPFPAPGGRPPAPSARKCCRGSGNRRARSVRWWQGRHGSGPASTAIDGTAGSRQGSERSGSVGPNSATTGVRVVAATCSGPLSPPM